MTNRGASLQMGNLTSRRTGLLITDEKTKDTGRNYCLSFQKAFERHIALDILYLHQNNFRNVDFDRFDYIIIGHTTVDYFNLMLGKTFLNKYKDRLWFIFKILRKLRKSKTSKILFSKDEALQKMCELCNFFTKLYNGSPAKGLHLCIVTIY